MFQDSQEKKLPDVSQERKVIYDKTENYFNSSEVKNLLQNKYRTQYFIFACPTLHHFKQLSNLPILTY